VRLDADLRNYTLSPLSRARTDVDGEACGRKLARDLAADTAAGASDKRC
jgi:hypothetical protein